jgi:hypothetical protein
VTTPDWSLSEQQQTAALYTRAGAAAATVVNPLYQLQPTQVYGSFTNRSKNDKNDKIPGETLKKG